LAARPPGEPALLGLLRVGLLLLLLLLLLLVGQSVLVLQLVLVRSLVVHHAGESHSVRFVSSLASSFRFFLILSGSFWFFLLLSGSFRPTSTADCCVLSCYMLATAS